MLLLQNEQINSIDRVRQSVFASAGTAAPSPAYTPNKIGEKVLPGGFMSPPASSDVSVTRRGTILDRIFSSSASATQTPLASGSSSSGIGRIKGGVPSANKLLQLHKKSMAGERGGKTLLHHHNRLPLASSAMPVYL